LFYVIFSVKDNKGPFLVGVEDNEFICFIEGWKSDNDYLPLSVHKLLCTLFKRY